MGRIEMTIRELITKLAPLNPDAEIRISCKDDTGYEYDYPLEELDIYEKNMLDDTLVEVWLRAHQP